MGSGVGAGSPAVQPLPAGMRGGNHGAYYTSHLGPQGATTCLPSPWGSKMLVAKLSPLTNQLCDPGYNLTSLSLSFSTCQEGSHFP